MSITYYVVLPFKRCERGDLVPVKSLEAPNRAAAKRRAQAMAAKYAGALAFSRTKSADRGNFGDAKVVAVFGTVDLSMLQGSDTGAICHQ